MDSFDTGRLIYLILLGLMVSGWFFMQGRGSWNKTLQQAAAWAFIFGGAVVAYGLWEDISRTVMPQQSVFADENRIVVPRSPNGHYYIEAGSQRRAHSLCAGYRGDVARADPGRRRSRRSAAR